MAEQGGTPGGRRGYAGTWPPQGAVPAGGLLPSRLSIWPPFIETLLTWVRAEAGAAAALSMIADQIPHRSVTTPCVRPVS